MVVVVAMVVFILFRLFSSVAGCSSLFTEVVTVMAGPAVYEWSKKLLW